MDQQCLRYIWCTDISGSLLAFFNSFISANSGLFCCRKSEHKVVIKPIGGYCTYSKATPHLTIVSYNPVGISASWNSCVSLASVPSGPSTGAMPNLLYVLVMMDWVDWPVSLVWDKAESKLNMRWIHEALFMFAEFNKRKETDEHCLWNWNVHNSTLIKRFVH